ncbi:leucine-rich repeat neuronal protein 2-like [Eucyclogobius newberryi]|uniref:leucine-rich repeat neuronal protein 2-like n=1 Tax=Eucyclogobius newberryi TaxID=166745 RepID=UPI003B5C4B57
MRPRPFPLHLHCTCIFLVICMPLVVGNLPHSLPWHVSCPVRCVCQIKPWFSFDSFYHEAQTVDCNDLLLTRLPSPIPKNTHTLRLQSNLLSDLDTSTLQKLPNLTDLDLSQNRFNHIRTITSGPPLRYLLALHLEENHLSHLPDASFPSLQLLQELFFSHNNLHTISPGAFAGLANLLRLHINNNRLTTIDPRWFNALPKLEVLMLGGNPVVALPEQAFIALKSLRSLVLGGMGLQNLAEKALDGLDQLESLSFFDNQLTEVPTQALRRVPALKFLDLNKNRIKLIQSGHFRDMLNLKELGLNNIDELVSIEKGALENLPELTKLEITNNPRLSYIHPHAFVRLTRLESLMLNSNALSALHHNIMLSLPNLQEVSLHSNPLRCDCLFRWAAEESPHLYIDKDASQSDAQSLRVVRFIQPQATLCAEPPELRSREVREVSTLEMSASCLPMIPSNSLPSYVGVRESGKLVLLCRALGAPQPEIYWVTPSGMKFGPNKPNLCRNFTRSKSNLTSSKHPDDQNRSSCNRNKHYKLLPEGTLELNKVTSHEAGLYTCVAENALGADTRSVTVGVHARESRRKKANLKTFVRAEVARLELREVGERYAILSWQNVRNLPSTRLSWQAIHANLHTPTYMTRILAGTQSFNLTHLQPETFHRACLHLGVAEDAKRVGKRARILRKPQCVTFRTKDVEEPEANLELKPELTSTAVTLLLLALMLLALAGQSFETESPKGDHVMLLQEVKGHAIQVKHDEGDDVKVPL